MDVSPFAVYGFSQTAQQVHFNHASVLIEPDALSDAQVNALVDERQLDDAIAQSVVSKKPIELLQPAQHEATTYFWKIFGSTFITIFLAELGDKTQVATLLMSAESHAPWSIFTGAAIALVTTSLLGVLVGQWLSSRVSPRTLDTAAGIMLALLSLWLLWDVVRM